MSGITRQLLLDVDVVVEAPVPSELSPDEMLRLVRHVLDREGAVGVWAVAVVLTDDDRLRALHRKFMGIDTETDVMTFPAAGAPGTTGPTRGGDIVVSIERVAVQGPAFGLSVADEVLFLVVHGMLHLLGWDDRADDDRAGMMQRQTDLLSGFRAMSDPDIG